MNELDRLKQLAGLETSSTSILREDEWDQKLRAAGDTQRMMHQDYEVDQFSDREDAAATRLAGQQDRELSDMLGAAGDTRRMMHQDYEVDQGSSLAGLQSKNQQQNQDQVVQAIQKGDDEIAQAEVKAGEKVLGVQQAQADADVQIKKIESDAVDQATQVGVNKDVNVAAAIDGQSEDLDQLAKDTDPNALGKMTQEEYDEHIQDTMSALLAQYGGDEEESWTDDVWDKVWTDLDQMDVERAKQQGNVEWLAAHNAASDTDDFGNPLQDTDAFGNYQYDERVDRRNRHLENPNRLFQDDEQLWNPSFESVNKWLSGMFDDSQISVINEKLNESPDYADVIKTMRNAGLSHDLVIARITEWANTPDGVGEVEPREHGDAYDMAQGVNLSLKRYLNAEDMKVTVTEHSVERMNALYENFKKKKKLTETIRDGDVFDKTQALAYFKNERSDFESSDLVKFKNKGSAIVDHWQDKETGELIPASEHTEHTVLANNGDYEFVKDITKDINYVIYKGKIIATGDFDYGADGWWLNITDANDNDSTNQEFFGDAANVVDYFAKHNITG